VHPRNIIVFNLPCIESEKNILNQSINQSIKTHLYSAICRERIRGALTSFTVTLTKNIFSNQKQTIKCALGPCCGLSAGCLPSADIRPAGKIIEYQLYQTGIFDKHTALKLIKPALNSLSTLVTLCSVHSNRLLVRIQKTTNAMLTVDVRLSSPFFICRNRT